MTARKWRERLKHMDFNENDLMRMSKRRFLKAAGQLGIASSALAYASQDAIARQTDNHDKRVTYAKFVRLHSEKPGQEPDREAVLTTMPRDDWSRKTAASDLARRMNREIKGWEHPEYVGAWMVPSESSPHEYDVEVAVETVMKANGETVSAHYSKEEVRRRLPDSADASAGGGEHERHFNDIPIRVVESESEETTMSCSYSEVPGGCSCSVGRENFTICAPFYNTNLDNEGWVVSGHGADQGGGIGSTMDQPSDSNDSTGTVESIYNSSEQDYAWVEATEYEGVRRSLRSALSGNCDSFAQIYGTVPDSTIKNETGTSTTYYLQGAESRKKSGEVNGFQPNDGGTDERMRHSKDAVAGDSGGPYFKIVNGEVHIAGTIDKNRTFGGSIGNTADAVSGGLTGYWMTK